MKGDPWRPVEAVLRDAAQAPAFSLFAALRSSPQGLTEATAAARAVGDRAASGRDSAPLVGAVVGDLFVLLLAGLGVVFAVLGDVRGWVTVAVVIGLSLGLRLAVACRARRVMAGMPGPGPATATVRRRASPDAASVVREVPWDDLVVGDVIVLAAGDVVAADARVLTGRHLRVDQSALSGETRAAVKTSAAPRRRDGVATPIFGLSSIAFAGSVVVSGRATAMVVATGAATVLSAAEQAAAAPRGRSSVDRGVRQVGLTFVRFMLVLVPLVLVTRGGVSSQWGQAGLFALAVAVGLTPELLPAIVTAGLARGAAVLGRYGLVVNRLEALGDLGGMDVLCVDKTGTLTSDRVAVAHSIDIDGRLDDTAVEHAYLVTLFQSGPPDPIDDAIIGHVGAGEDLLAAARYQLVDELPFEYDRRMASVVLRARQG
ncbi:MAG: magnesium-translocating P-type ATPase, partial [Pseudonocardia sp.]|nr:magnesium-translocating P-type ATPase [Pseudonocardia sp.]